MNEQEMYQAILNKNENGYHTMINKYYHLYYKVIADTLSYFSCEEDIKDCMSESLIYLWFHIEKYDPSKCSLRNWSCMIVHDRAINRRNYYERQSQRIDNLITSISLEDNFYYSSEDIFFQNEQITEIFVLIEELREPIREIIRRRYIFGEKPTQISNALNMPVKKIENYLYKGKRILQGRRNKG